MLGRNWLKFSNFLDVFLQANCPLCDRSTPDRICRDCDRQLTACRCSQFRQADKLNNQIELFSWGIYDGALKRAIAACKFENHPEIASFLGTTMAEAWIEESRTKRLGKPSVVPIPLHAQKLKSRGFNQAEILARSFCDLTGLACATDGLQRVKNTKPQIETKNQQERAENLRQAFVGKPANFRNARSVLLLDDIYTSGATAREAIAALEKVNIKVSGVVVLARPQMTKN